MIKVKQKLPVALLETFIVFSRELTTAKTARFLNLTQPTVSRQLIQLENSLPQKFFRMKGRNKVLTDYGKALAHELEKDFQQIGKTIHRMNQIYLAPEQIKITIAARQEILEQHIINYDFPGTVELRHMGTREIINQIQAQTIDIAISHDISFNSDYIRKKIFTSSAKIIIPKKWFSTKPSLNQWIKCAALHPLAQYQGSYSHLDKFKEIYQLKEQFKICLITEYWPLIEKRTVLGKSWAIIPSSFISDKNQYYIIDLPLEFEDQTFYLIYRKEFEKQEWFKKFLTSIL